MIYFWVINKVKSQSVKNSFQPKKTISKKDNLQIKHELIEMNDADLFFL